MTAMRKLSRRMPPAVSPLIRLDKKIADNETLTRFIVALSRETVPAEIIKHSAACLKEIINHRLFAFAIRNGNRVDIWGKPGTGNKPFRELLLNDFNVTGAASLNLAVHSFHPDRQESRLTPRNLISHETGGQENLSKIYMIPGHKRSGYHGDIANIVLQSCSQAVSRHMNVTNKQPCKGNVTAASPW
ncbi:MAG: hypothetical protein GY737_06695 [Desulfobacteraceae bacterium]|nr:hypothetical protein [Desulfobacteraceae bacterium]